MSDSEQLVETLNELSARLAEFGLRKELLMLRCAVAMFRGRFEDLRNVALLPTCLSTLAIEWPEEAQTLNAAAKVLEKSVPGWRVWWRMKHGRT